MNNYFKSRIPASLAVLILCLFTAPHTVVHGAGRCPAGSVPVEEVGSGEFSCEQRQSSNSRSLSSGVGLPNAPGEPQAPAKPGAPAAAQKPLQLQPGQQDCELSRWSCEQSCQKTYLSSMTGVAADAAQRAKLVLETCLLICEKELACSSAVEGEAL